MKYYNEEIIQKIIKQLPKRRKGKRGPEPIQKEVLVQALLFWLKTGYCWSMVPHSATVRRYFFELQRRGMISNLLFKHNKIKKKPKYAVIDSTNVNTYKNNPLSKYSGKYHNYCIKLSLGIKEDGKIYSISMDKGSTNDSKILDKILSLNPKLPYELYLDKGYENYNRRRKLKKNNCQVRMEQRNYAKNKKRGPRFLFNTSHKK